MVISIIILGFVLVCFVGFTPKVNKYFFTTISNPQVNKIEVSFANTRYKKILSVNEKTRLVNLLKMIKKEDMLPYSPSKIEVNNLAITISLKLIGSIVIVPMNSSSYAESFIFRYENKYYITYQPALSSLFERLCQEYLQSIYPQNILLGSYKINVNQISKVYITSRLINKILLSKKQVNDIMSILNRSEKRYRFFGFVASSGPPGRLAIDIYTNKNYRITIYPYDTGYSIDTVIGMISDTWATNTYFVTLSQNVENINNSLRFKAIKNAIARLLNNYSNYYEKIIDEINSLDITEDNRSQLLSMFKDNDVLSVDATKRQLDAYFEKVAKSDNQGRYFDSYYSNCDSYLSNQTKKLEGFENEYIKDNAQLDTTGSAIN